MSLGHISNSRDQVVPVVGLARGKVFEPCPRVCKVQRKVADDHGIVGRATQLACQAVVIEPERGIGLPRVLDEVCRLTKAWGEQSSANFPAEHTGAEPPVIRSCRARG